MKACLLCIILIFSWSAASSQDYFTKRKVREFNSLYHPERNCRYVRPLVRYRYPVIIIIEEEHVETKKERRNREWRARPFSRRKTQEEPAQQDNIKEE